MGNPFDKHKFADQPVYHANTVKIEARSQLVEAYRTITGLTKIPPHKGYWTLCNRQPDLEGSEIVQLVNAGLIEKQQFFGVDNDIRKEGIIEYNEGQHPEANWLCGDWLEVLEENYDIFDPSLIYMDYTRTVMRPSCHIYVARTINMCPSNTVIAVNLMLSDGHSRKRFDSKFFVEAVRKYVRDSQDWTVSEQFYSYKASRTEMGTFIFTRR